MSRRKVDGLWSDSKLAELVLKGKGTGNQLGIGSYGSVEEV